VSLQYTLAFLAELRENNNKAWFDEHRSWYKQARSAFEQVVGDVISQLTMIEELGNISPKDCMFRINRDVRFSKDKSPYNTAMSASIGPGGRHGEGHSYFLHIAPGDSFVGSGLFEPDKAVLDNVRQHIALDAHPLRTIIGSATFVTYFGAMHGDTLKTAPVGYDRNHPAVDLLRYKQFLAVHKFSDDDVIEPEFGAKVVAVCVAMRPFLDYLDSASVAPPKRQ
jgi:uncharacterized protein (TIGR02453 family)